MAIFTIPASAKTPGTAGHTSDHNLFTAALAAIGAGNVLNTGYGGGADLSGVADSTAAILAALTTAGIAILPPGTYKVGNLVMPSGSVLTGYGATIVQTAAGATITMSGTGCRVTGITGYGGTGTTSSNPAADLIATASGATRWAVADLNASFCNGYVINPVLAASTHGQVTNVDVTDCKGGILLSQGTGTTTITAEIMMNAVNIQRCKTNPALSIMGVTDYIGQGLNFSTDGSTNTGPTTLIQGKGGGSLAGIDWGVTGTATAGVGVLTIGEAGGAGNAPSNLNIVGGQIQQGGVGVLMSGALARSRFIGIMSSGNLGDGWKFTGTAPGPAVTGTAILIDDCSGNTNNGAAGTAYDVEVASGATGHIGIFGFAYCSTGVTNSLIVPATNNTSNVNSTSPGGKTVSGAATGW